ncbi:ABC transporter ATP-binding protein/permease [Nocardiopsis exhalans]|uniref:ABC transporter ATP-binding protein/permease n=1 Tax=Nocardiopsis exhalans TaxID=163604 RepID=A0ABY5D2F4_9ACTN|nr:ABC transporter ATP-binding protein [Nocardiopsis exhalans]USY17349.1 ABC transporter ATP-binding protein/permease [Nocardiopsis exhalans]
MSTETTTEAAPDGPGDTGPGQPGGPELLPTATARRTWAVLGDGIRATPWAAALALVTVLAGSAAGLVAPWVLGSIVDDISAGAGLDAILRSAALIAAAALVGGVLVGLGAWQVSRLGETILARLRERVMERVLHMPAARLEKVRIGDLLSRVGDDVAVVTNAIARNGPEVVTALAMVVLTTAGMAALDWRLGLAGLAAMPFYVWAVRWYMPRSGPYYARERIAMGERSHALMGALRGRDTVRAYRLEEEHEQRIAERSRTAMQLTLDVFRLFTRLGARMNGSEFVGLAAVLVVGFWLVRGDLVTVGMVTAAALYFHRLFGPVGFLVMNFNDVQQAGASLARLAGVVDLPVADDPRAEEGPAGSSLRVERVSHAYAPGAPKALDGVTLKVAPGERVALVGASGAGKTTLAAVVSGLRTPTAGTVYLGGIPLDELGEQRVREHVFLVSQETHVFAGTLLDDLRLARAEATAEEVEAALETVGALDWVRALPEGLETVVGEGGHALTAEQAQHLALARLVLADPDLAVLDEATAEAGSSGARRLEGAAVAATKGRTTLVVAHRLTQAQAADRVVVMEQGRVVEEGTHDDLVAGEGSYARLWRSWQG